MPVNDQTKIPDTSYSRFALADQSTVINARIRDEAARNSPTPAEMRQRTGSGGPVSQIYAPIPPKAVPPKSTNHKTNPVTFYDREVPYLGLIPYFRCQPVGEKDCIDRPATEKDKENNPREWNDYLSKKPQIYGTPLSVLGCLTDKQLRECADAHFHSVEQAEQLSDAAFDNLHYIGLPPDLRAKAARYRNYAKAQKLIDEKDEEIANLKHEIEELKKPRSKPKV